MTDWSLLGGDPAPGDPSVLRRFAGQFDDVADTASAQLRRLRVVEQVDLGSWQGPAADACRPKLESFAGHLAALEASHRQAADALRAYAARLEDLQVQAQQLLGAARTAQLRAETAGRDVDRAQERLLGVQAPPPHSLLDGSAPSWRGPTLQDLAMAQAASDAVQADLDSARSTLAWCRDQAITLSAQKEIACRQCSAVLEETARPASALRPPDWWSRATGVLDRAAHTVAHDARRAGSWLAQDVETNGKIALDGAGLVGSAALTVVGGMGAGFGVGLDLTGVGALVGVPLDAAGVALAAAGVGGVGFFADQLSHDLGTHRASQVDGSGSGSGAEPEGTAPPGAGRSEADVDKVLGELRSGRTPPNLEVDTPAEIQELYDRLSQGGAPFHSSYRGKMVELSDGTRVGIRADSRSGGPALDIFKPNRVRIKVHLP